MRRTSIDRVILAVAVAAIAFSCTPPTSPLDLAGVYSLQSVNGQPLPYVFPGTGSTTVEVLDDSYTLNPGGTYAEAGHKRYIAGGMVYVAFPVDAGNFTRRGDAITLESLIYSSSTGRISDGTFTIVQQDLTLVYRK